jgi:hypothetical protein
MPVEYQNYSVEELDISFSHVVLEIPRSSPLRPHIPLTSPLNHTRFFSALRVMQMDNDHINRWQLSSSDGN